MPTPVLRPRRMDAIINLAELRHDPWRRSGEHAGRVHVMRAAGSTASAASSTATRSSRWRRIPPATCRIATPRRLDVPPRHATTLLRQQFFGQNLPIFAEQLGSPARHCSIAGSSIPHGRASGSSPHPFSISWEDSGRRWRRGDGERMPRPFESSHLADSPHNRYRNDAARRCSAGAARRLDRLWYRHGN